MTIIEKIKAEIERRKSLLTQHSKLTYDLILETFIKEYDDLLSFLSTLEESERPEPYNPVYDETYLNEKIKKATESWKGVDVDAMLAECRGIEERPINLDFDKAWEEYGKSKGGGAITVNVKDLARHFYDLGCRRTAEKYDEIEYNRQRAEESEKPMNLEEEINRYLREECSDDDEPGIHEIAEHFAKWGAEHLASTGKTISVKPGDEVTINGHKIVYDKDNGYVTIVKSEESVPNDLEGAAEKYFIKVPCSEEVKKTLIEIYKPGIDAFKAGAEWQADHAPLPEDTVLFNKGVEEGKRLMIDEVAEYEVWDFSSSLEACPHVNIPLDNKQYRNGDKVRVIVLPKED